MSDPTTIRPRVAVQRPHRADARRNFDALLEAARDVFAEQGTSGSLEEVARRAGVGIGTLYRHFPQREALVEAVYREQVADLRAGAEALLRKHSPARALRAWMDLFADWADAKRGMVRTLAAMRSDATLDVGMSRREIESIIATILAAGAKAGDLRADADPADLRSLLSGILATATDRAQAGRLFDLALDALRPERGDR
jgi:AcrR family transcriptional regulator